MAAATVCRPPGAARRAVCAASRSRKSLLCGVSLRAAAERPPLATLAAEPEASSSSTSTTEPDNAAAVSTVQVRVYNIDRWGMAKKYGQAVTKKPLEAIWHVGVAAYGNEYWFDHQINVQNLEHVDYAYGFGPTYVYDLGATSLTQAEFDAHVFDTLSDKYNLEAYDCFNNNCHHFADEISKHLTGQGIPQWCLDHGEQGLDAWADEDRDRIAWASNKIAKIMMLAWGRYNKERFIERNAEARAKAQGGGATVIDPATTTVIVGTQHDDDR